MRLCWSRTRRPACVSEDGAAGLERPGRQTLSAGYGRVVHGGDGLTGPAPRPNRSGAERNLGVPRWLRRLEEDARERGDHACAGRLCAALELRRGGDRHGADEAGCGIVAPCCPPSGIGHDSSQFVAAFPAYPPPPCTGGVFGLLSDAPAPP